jgi:peptide/nickel transport system permease protein
VQPVNQQLGAAEPLSVFVQRGSLHKLAWTAGRFAWGYPLGAAGGLMLLVMIFIAVFAPYVAPYDPLGQDVPNQYRSPGSPFWFGTDAFGRDSLSRIIFGARTSLYVGLMAVAFGSVSGTLLGVASGYMGGRFDIIVQRLVDAIMGFPSLVLALVLVVALGGSLNNVTLAIAVVFIPRAVRLARSSALSIKEEVYVAACQAIGASSLRVMFRHVLPNCLAPVFVLATGYLGTAVVTESSLSFLGLGVPPPHVSWGGMLNVGAHGHLEFAPWLAIFPGLAITLVVFAFAFLGDALRDALDPRLRGR